MKNFGLIGKSLAHTFSKNHFNTLFAQENLVDATYTNFEIQNLNSLFELIHANKLSGLNVTSPFKTDIIKHIDELTQDAQTINAVNCIKINWQYNKPYLIGYNTDAFGFSKSIKPFLSPSHQSALILGTGGSSKAIEYALNQFGIKVFYVSSTSHVQTDNTLHYTQLNETILKTCTLIINCTPLGSGKFINQAPEIPYQYVTSTHLLIDLNYNPETTLFMQKGITAVTLNGLNMLQFQAQKTWEIWNSN